LAGIVSCSGLLTCTVSITVPELAMTFTTSVNVAVAPLANDAFVQVIVPLAPIAGVVQLKPPGLLIDWKPTEPGEICENVVFGRVRPVVASRPACT
jgi:hypothetical protein